MEMQVNKQLCAGCGACISVCPMDAIHMLDGVAVLDTEKCSQCQACADVCPQGAITAVGVPAVTANPALFQPKPETKVVVAEPVSVIEKPWLAAALHLPDRKFFPGLRKRWFPRWSGGFRAHNLPRSLIPD